MSLRIVAVCEPRTFFNIVDEIGEATSYEEHDDFSVKAVFHINTLTLGAIAALSGCSTCKVACEEKLIKRILEFKYNGSVAV